MIEEPRAGYSIGISKSTRERHSGHVDRQATFQSRWALLKSFIAELFAPDGKPLLLINSAEEAARGLHLNHFDRQLNHELSITFYETFQQWTHRLKELKHEVQIVQLVEFYSRLQKSAGLLAEVLANWQASYLASKEEKTIQRMALNILHNQLSNQPALEQAISEAVLAAIDEWREDRPGGFNRRLVEMSLQTGMFHKSIEAEMLQRSKNYYLRKRDKLPTNISFIQAVKRELDKESFLMELTHPSENTVRIVEKEFISEHLDEMVNFLDYLISHEQREDLKLLWQFFSRVDRVAMLEHRLEQLIDDSDKFITAGHVDQLLAYKLKMETLIESTLGDKQLLQLITNRFQAVVSEHFTRCNELMVSYLIESLQSSMQEEGTVSLSWEILRLNPGLDLFLDLYRTQLAREILTNPLLDMHLHCGFIERAKQHCGATLVAPLEKMVSDVWKNGASIVHQHGQFRCLMLFKRHWPKLPSYGDLNIPDAMRHIRNEFEDHQHERNPPRELTWLSCLGLCKVEVGHLTHTLTELQASIVLYVSRAIRPMKQEELTTVLKIDREAVRKATQQLVEAGLLTVGGNSHTYEVCYESKQQTHASLQLPKMAVDQKSTTGDRDITTEACLIRLLKSKKVVERAQIFPQIAIMIRHFKPTIELVNNCIKRLCDKEYLRVAGNSVHYVP